MRATGSRGARAASRHPGALLALLLGAVAISSALAASPHTHGQDEPHLHAAPAPTAPGYSPLPHPGPAAGSYTLPKIRKAPDGEVLLASGARARLQQVFGGRMVVLSFIFTHCADPGGCPLASFVMRQVGRRVAADPALAGNVRLASLSFDPVRDTPERMQAYAATLQAEGLDWQFLTTRSEEAIAPLLKDWGQSVIKDPAGGSYSHQLRVFLVDEAGDIRNEYSTSFLHADTVLADLRTLVAGDAASAPAEAAQAPAGLAAGDDKTGYESPGYRTRSRALAVRAGTGLDLRTLMQTPPLGLPARMPGVETLPSDAQIALGRRLFQDRRLSHNNTLSCASCHLPDQGFTNQELRTPVGIEGRTVKRNAPSLYNVAYMRRLFHDAREYGLEQQIWAPLLAMNEMGNPSIGYLLEKLAATDDYAALFEQAFPDLGLQMQTLGMALAAYQRGLLSGDSAFDRWRYGNDASALGDSARRGFALFTGKAGCSNCHSIGKKDALFTDHQLHNTGVGYARSMSRPAPESAPVGPGQSLKLAAGVVDASSEVPPNDLGRYEVTLKTADRWKYRTPGLRNVAVTAPYMHDGSLATLGEVLDFYAAGGIANEGLDPAIKAFAMSPAEKRDLLSFLNSLTGSNVDSLTLDAFSQAIGH